MEWFRGGPISKNIWCKHSNYYQHNAVYIKTCWGYIKRVAALSTGASWCLDCNRVTSSFMGGVRDWVCDCIVRGWDIYSFTDGKVLLHRWLLVARFYHVHCIQCGTYCFIKAGNDWNELIYPSSCYFWSIWNCKHIAIIKKQSSYNDDHSLLNYR